MSVSKKDTSQGTRKNGCIETDCIVKLPCPRNPLIKTIDGFCVHKVTKTRRNAIPKKCLSGKET